MNNNYNELEKKLGTNFQNQELLITALTHRSYLNENREQGLVHNERLEFLGDAVLELITSIYLFETYPERPEGELTSFRSAIVRTESLAKASRELGVGEYLRMSRGEFESGGSNKDYLLANTYESILGAMYLDRGYEECKKFVHRTLVPKVDEIVENRLDIDAKTKIQEMIQSLYKVTPTYDVIDEDGPDHDKTFTVGVKIEKEVIGTGQGSSKQKAEESAAAEGIKFLQKKHKNLE